MSNINVKSDTDIYNEILTDFRTNLDTGISTYRHSGIDDIFIQPLLGQVSDTYIISDFINRCRTLTELEKVVKSPDYILRLAYAFNYTYTQTETLISNSIDNLISDYSEARLSAEQSRGYIRLYFNEGSAKTIGSDLRMSTLDNIEFKTTNSFTNFTPSYDAGEGLYYIDSAIQSIDYGIDTNVESGTIIKLLSSVPTLVKVTNLQRTQFGRDDETDLEVITRVRNILSSRRTSVFTGFTNMLLTYPGILDVSIVMPGSTNQIRYEKNAVDIYIISEERRQIKEDIFHTTNARYAWERIDDEINYDIYPVDFVGDYSYFKLLSQPALEIISVEYSEDNGSTWTAFTSGDYELKNDSTSSWKNSVKGHDYVEVNNTSLPDDSLTKITYYYDKTFKNLQNLLLNYDNTVIGADILIKKGTESAVDIYVEPTLFNGENIETVKANITTNLRRYFEGGVDLNGVQRYSYKLGQTLDKSDVANVIIDTAGVDYIDLDTFEITIEGDSDWQRYSPSFANYLRLGTITFGTITYIQPQPIVNIT